MTNKINYSKIPEFERDFKRWGKRFKTLDKDLYGYVVFETDKEWTEYFNIIGSKNCLFIHHLDNKKTIDYSNTYTTIKTTKPIYVYFEKILWKNKRIKLSILIKWLIHNIYNNII